MKPAFIVHRPGGRYEFSLVDPAYHPSGGDVVYVRVRDGSVDLARYLGQDDVGRYLIDWHLRETVDTVDPGDLVSFHPITWVGRQPLPAGISDFVRRLVTEYPARLLAGS